MAAAAALNVVKQIQVLADGPETQEMRDCLSQVVASLQFFLDHPDSLVRTQASRTLVKLAKGYPSDVARLDLSRARSSLARVSEALDIGDSVDAGADDVRRLMTELFEAIEAPCAKPVAAPNGEPNEPELPSRSPPPDRREAGEGCDGAQSSLAKAASVTDSRGEVVMNVGEPADGKVKAAILEKVVSFQGVVSVTFEDTFIIVNTRTKAHATDAGLLADLIGALRAQGLQNASVATNPRSNAESAEEVPPTTAGASAPSVRGHAAPEEAETEVAASFDSPDDGEPAYLDDEEEMLTARGCGGGDRGPDGHEAGIGSGVRSGGFGFAAGNFPGGGGSPTMGTGGPVAMHAAGGMGMNGGYAPQWSFFSQNHWMTGRRVQEFEDDPTIAARLAKAKKKEEQRKVEEKSRFGRLFSVLSRT